jgi:hypothetical protein
LEVTDPLINTKYIRERTRGADPTKVVWEILKLHFFKITFVGAAFFI